METTGPKLTDLNMIFVKIIEPRAKEIKKQYANRATQDCILEDDFSYCVFLATKEFYDDFTRIQREGKSFN